MFEFAFSLGIYSYLIFFLGITGRLYPQSVFIVSFLYLVILIFLIRKRIKKPKIQLDKFGKLLFALLLVQILVNLIGALGPELSFDALWYHLTLPKIFLLNHSIFYIPGGLLYYSLFPKLGEMLFLAALSVDGEIFAKLIHFIFGILTIVITYKISRKILNQNFSLLASLIFSSNLVFSWESTTAYIDLIRSFFEILTLWAFLNKDTIRSGISLGLAISTKLLSLGSLPIFLTLHVLFRRKYFKNIVVFTILSILVPLPWLMVSFIKTGNPIYPLFTNYYQTSINISFFQIIPDTVHLLLKADDPISPIYLITMPLIILSFKKFNQSLKIITIYSLLAILILYLIPRTGGGRFILPYLPAFSILVSGTIAVLKFNQLKKLLIILIIFIALATIGFRSITNYKYLNIILGRESKGEFLTKNLNFNFGDFYDVDGFFKQMIKAEDKVLLYGFHNLYYVNFPFIHESWVKKGDRFKYIATSKDSKLPKKFSFWSLIYYNQTTGVKVYSLNKEWVY